MNNPLKLILISRFPDIYIFLLIGIMISFLDALLIRWKGVHLFYEHIVKHGLIAAIITSIVIMVLVLIVFVVISVVTDSLSGTQSECINIRKRTVSTYLASQNIVLRDKEEILMAVAKEPFDKGFVLTNQRMFYYELDHIVNKVYLEETQKVNYELKFMNLILSFYLKDNSVITFDIKDVSVRDMLGKIKEELKNKVQKKGFIENAG